MTDTVTVTVTEPIPTTTDSWNQQLDQLRTRYRGVRPAVLQTAVEGTP